MTAPVPAAGPHTGVVRAKHQWDARALLARIGWPEPDVDTEDAVAGALAEAEEYGVRRALHRLGPCIADAEIARAELASEVDL